MASVPGNLKRVSRGLVPGPGILSDFDGDIDRWLKSVQAPPGGDMDVLTLGNPWETDARIEHYFRAVYTAARPHFQELKALDHWLADCRSDGQLMAFMSVEKHNDAYEANQNDRLLIILHSPGTLTLSVFDEDDSENEMARALMESGDVFWFDENCPHEVMHISVLMDSEQMAVMDDVVIAFNVPSLYHC